jgi:hypothetical protein
MLQRDYAPGSQPHQRDLQSQGRQLSSSSAPSRSWFPARRRPHHPM